MERGKLALSRLLHQRTLDLREATLAGFRLWLGHQVARWGNDPVFVHRSLIRDLRRAHADLLALEEEVRRAERADRAAGSFEALGRLDRQLMDAEKAITGITAVMTQAVAERRTELSLKLDRFRAAHAQMSLERESLIRASPERRELLRLRDQLSRLRIVTGVERAEADLARLLREQGRSSGRSGGAFERMAMEVTHRTIVPDLVEAHALGGRDERLVVLSGVTLGAAATELDQVVVLTGERPGRPVQVLAVIEVKRNINDLGHGFRRRQADLSWLTGDSERYDPEPLRTRTFPSGHFDRPAMHRQDGRDFVFDPTSFAGLRRDREAGYILQGVYFITRPATLWGASAAALSRISRAATDLRWDPDDEDYLRDLLRWCLTLTDPIEAPDVVAMYARDAELADQLLMVERAAST